MANPFDQFDKPQPQQMPQPQANPFDEFDAPQPQPQPTQTEASGVFEAFQAGYQGSALGLGPGFDVGPLRIGGRGKLPDIVLSPTDADWYERLASGVGSVLSELPFGIVGAIGGGAAGGAAGTAVPVVGNVTGAVVGAGAGSMALPAAIRESYIQAYTKGEIESTADFLNRVGLVLKQTGKEGLVGALTGGAGRTAQLTAQAAGAGAKTTAAAVLTAEGATLVVAPAALEGRLPEPQEFMDAAILLVGFKSATSGAAKLAEIYRRTGKTPIEVLADAAKDPTIIEDLGGETALTVARENNVFTGQAPGAGSRVGFTQSPDTPVDKLFSNFGDMKLGKDWRDMSGQNRTREQVEAENTTNLRLKMFERANADPKQFSADTVSAQNFDLGDGVSIKIDAGKAGNTRLQISVNGEIAGAARIEKGMIDSMAVKPEFAGRDIGVTMLRWMNDNGVANVREVPDRSPGFVRAQKKVLSEPAKPEAAPDAAQPDTEIPRAYQEQAKQENARNAVPPPSKEAAEFLEKPFAEVPQLPGEPVLKTHVNYNYINTTDDVKGAMSRLSELYEQNIRSATRDKVTWEQTYAEAKEIYRTTTGEEPPPTPLANADYAKLSADLYARKQLLVSGAEQLMTLRNDYVKAKAENRATDQMRLEVLAQIDRIGKAQAEVRGAQAEVGRALNILRSTNRDKAYYDELNEILNQKFKTGDNINDTINRPTFDNIMDMLGQYDKPGQTLKFASKATKPNWLDKFFEIYTAGLVSGVITQTANIYGNAAMLPLRPLVDAAAVGFGALRKDGERVAAAEPFARAAGTVLGVVDAARIAGAVARSGVPYKMVPDQIRNANTGKFGEIVRIPFRGLASTDAFFRVLNERAEAYTLAARQATKEGLNPATREFRERVVQIAADPPEAMQKQIEDAGLRFTFASPVGSLGQTLLTARRKSPLLNLIVPFVQTPINAVKEMLRYSPLSPAVKEWRDDIRKGGVARDKAIAEVSLGVAMGATVMTLAAADMLSGNGPVEPEKRRILLAAKWQPYSIKVGGKWYSYQRIQPLGGLLGMYADTQEIWERMTEDEQQNAMAAIGAAFANAITNQTFLQGITNFIEAFSEPERFMERYIQNQVASFVPGILGQTAQLTDPYRREVYSILDAVTNRIPLASQTLLPARDPFGEPIENKDRVGIIGPITVTTESDDKVRSEAARLGLGVGPTRKFIELKDMGEDDLGRVNLTPEQRDVFAEQSGKMAYAILDQLVNSPGWDDMPDIIQRQTMERVFEDARKYGRALAVPPEQLIQEYERINEGLGKRLQSK
jgi:hypothetical protein